MAETEQKPSDYWAQWDGIPLIHTPKTPQEWAALDAKGACRCG